MKRFSLGVLFVFSFSAFLFAQEYRYTVDLVSVKNDRVAVSLETPLISVSEAYFHFPMTVPGTYARLDYGRYIADFKAFDKAGNLLKIKKQGENTWKIFGADRLSRITYLVNDSWDSGVRKNKIFEPAGTNFDAGKNFMLNNAGLFGFFAGTENYPLSIEVKKPVNLKGYTALPVTERKSDVEKFRAKSYHQLIDCPVFYTGNDTTAFMLGNTYVQIATYVEKGDSAALKIYEEIKPSMNAIRNFLGTLPVNNYTFLLYLKDYQELGKELKKDKLKLGTIIRLISQLAGQGFGALEHGNSSVYFLPDFGERSYTNMVKDVAIHEFMHIVTPLNLHSELIGNFDYVEPKMSKHLWLYEGVTEYFAGLIQMQDSLVSVNNYLQKTMRAKIVTGLRFPATMSFTEMSANVFDNPYKNQYTQVYERGAVIGMLLDFEIMRLTGGTKTLKDVVLSLGRKYGERSFKEDELFDQFTAEVHPDLRKFFSRYVEGKDSLDLTGGFRSVGINYYKELRENIPMDMLSKDNDVKANAGIVINNKVRVTKVGKGDIAGFKVGDQVDRDELQQAFKNPDGSYVPEGTMITLKVLREGKDVPLTFPARFREGVVKNKIIIDRGMNAEQRKLFEKWTKG